MRYYKKEDGAFIRTIGTLDLPEITAEEYETEMTAVSKRMEKQAVIAEATRSLTLEEVQVLMIRRTVNSLDIPDATASRMVAYYPELTGDGSLVKAGTKINWRGQLKKAAVDLWDTETNTPDAAPTLWADIAYRDGIRIAPETFTSTNAAAMDELMWFGEHIYRSGMAGNVYTPEQAPNAWEQCVNAL